MTALEDEVNRSRERLRKLSDEGVLRSYYRRLERIDFEERIVRAAEIIRDVEEELPGELPEPGEDSPYHDSFREYEQLRQYISSQKKSAQETIGERISSLTELYFDANAGDEDLRELNHVKSELEEVRNASSILSEHHHSQRCEEILRSVEHSIDHVVEQELDERFKFHESRKKYDSEYNRLKSEFDSVDISSRKSLKRLKELALESHNLVEKYKSISDEEGISQSARLHEDIEEAADRVAPIYESWKRRNITIGLLVMTAGFGFWKGAYVKEFATDIFRSDMAVAEANMVSQQLEEKIEKHIEDLKIQMQDLERLKGVKDSLSRELEGEVSYIQEEKEERASYEAGKPSVSIDIDLKEDSARVTNLVTSKHLMIPYTANLRKTPLGEYEIVSAGRKLTDSLDTVVIAPAQNPRYRKAIEKGTLSTDGEILFKPEDYQEIYGHLRNTGSTAIVTIER